MFEESPDAFMARFGTFAASVELFAHTEGNPLLECRAGDAIFQVFERTGPYLSHAGRALMIINPSTRELVAGTPGNKRIEATGLAQLRAEGMVLAREPLFAVIDAGAPLVVGVSGGVPDEVSSGDWVSFESDAPVHAFVLPPSRRSAPEQRRDELS